MHGDTHLFYLCSFTPTLMNGRSPKLNLNLPLVSLARESQMLKVSRFDTEIKQYGY